LSLSTIRRKIKSNALPFRLEKGKYFILFTEPATQPAVQTPLAMAAPVPFATPTTRSAPVEDASVQARFLAYERSLREKEERIRSLELANRELEQRLEELRILVKVLEEKYEVRY
jgi:predicted RNase H-like nuclease (RuvC/YqgF family)